MSLETIFQLIVIVFINALSNCIGTLKTVFLAKKYLKPAYIVTFLDAVIFATVMKQIASQDGLWFILAFALGKVIGVYIAEEIESHIALGILEVDIFVSNKEKMKAVADLLREKGYAVNTHVSYGYKGMKRYEIEVTILRKEFPLLEQILKTYFDNPTIKVKEVSKVKGKITVSSTQTS